ncbi:MAG: hypothetical protein HY320_06405, partial [Armatimonadetes bacterium]|nr:hypothetical protein [Armatimonadota bacterium]
AGAWIAITCASAAAQRQMASDHDALIDVARTSFGTAIRSGLRGFLVGAVAGAILLGLYFWFSDPDRVRGDRRPADEDSSHWV